MKPATLFLIVPLFITGLLPPVLAGEEPITRLILKFRDMTDTTVALARIETLAAEHGLPVRLEKLRRTGSGAWIIHVHGLAGAERPALLEMLQRQDNVAYAEYPRRARAR